MSIVIDPYVCIGCTKCTLVCPGTLIEMIVGVVFPA